MKLLSYLSVITLIIFIAFTSCSKDNDEIENDEINDENGNGDEVEYGEVSDIEGNEYKTVVIGSQEWMAENLRTGKYNDGTTIPHVTDNEEWNTTQYGAYYIVPYDLADGVDSEQEMAKLYGKLYNWHAVLDNKGLCPDGWKVPSDDDWTILEEYLITNHDLHNDPQSNDQDGVGNYLKSCRQKDSQLGGDCDTEEHPYWDGGDFFYGVDYYGFSALPAGERLISGMPHGLTSLAMFWSYTPQGSASAVNRVLSITSASLNADFAPRNNGHSVRCMRYID